MSHIVRAHTDAAGYAAAVCGFLPDVADGERREIEQDLTARLLADECADLVATHGTPEQYAEQLREAMNLEPYPPASLRARRRRRRFVGVAAAIGLVASAVAAVTWLRDDPVPDPYNAAIGLVMSNGQAEIVGPLLRVPLQPGPAGTVALAVQNNGPRTMRVTELASRAGIDVRNEAGGRTVRVGDSLPPVVTLLDVRAYPQADPKDIAVVTDPASPLRRDLPLDISPGDVVLLVAEIDVNYCANGAAGDAVGDALSLTLSVDGAERTIRGPQLWFEFADCAGG